MRFEDTLYNIANEAMKEKFLEIMDEKKEEIQKIINEIFTTEMATAWIEDFIKYGDEFRDKIIELAEEEMMDRVKGLFKGT